MRLALRLAACWGLAGALLVPAGAQAPPSINRETPKVLRYAFQVAETGFDPAQLPDIYSRIVTAHIFESPLSYDHLARPFKLVPSTAASLPEVSDDFKTYTFHIRPGIYFADDPAFKGRRRELVAQDYVYSIKRIYDPALNAPAQSNLEDEGIIGLQELREAALKSKKPFDYDREVEGIKAIDRYTLRVRLRESRPRHIHTWTARDVYGAVAREVVEYYGDKISAHPVGTGPFRLADWRRSSRIVLERNPTHRDEFYNAEPNPDDTEGRAILERLRGKRLPMIDGVEIAIIEQPQPRWLSFLNAEHDFLERLPNEFIGQAMPGGKPPPGLAKRGIRGYRVPAADTTLIVHNMEHPVVGGYTPDKVALRRAMVLGNDVVREIQLARRGQALPAMSMMPPMTLGYQPGMRTEMGEFSRPRAKALLDLYGYVDRDGDGWREQPDGSPLVLELASQSDQTSRQLDELWKKDMDALGLRVVLKIAQWPENLKAVRGGNFTMWRVSSTAAGPDGKDSLERAYGGSVGKGNLARFKLAAFDRIYERLSEMPDGPQRQAAFDEATRLLVAYAPYRFSVHRVITDMAYGSLIGYRRPPFWLDWWQYVDIDTEAQKRSAKK